MECIIRPDARSAAGLVARIIDQALRANPKLVLGLATGRTMELLYGTLVRIHREEGLDFSDCQTFNLDEYVGLTADDPHSYRHYMEHHLFKQVNLNPRNTHLPDGAAPDPDAESRRYEGLIEQAGGIDLQLLGIGQSGHIGFNEPGSHPDSRTRVVELGASTREDAAGHFGGLDRVPLRGISMGVASILEARRVVLLAGGEAKAAIVASALTGEVTSDVPASFLQNHGNAAFYIDAEASRLVGNLAQPAD